MRKCNTKQPGKQDPQKVKLVARVENDPQNQLKSTVASKIVRTAVEYTLNNIMMDQMSNHQQLRVLVEQLQREANIDRMKTSEAITHLKRYISEHQAEDYLLVGFTSQKANPFREKSSCTVL
ncbi:guanine nucleotide-binding protein subunit gamma-1-like [Panulirus ornatus]|uniref:guanine nucleotide-binding protein subunit gamma-1-like n=1 Tax=Panulirus ornatus TaxID=150431 RepID=UPI003A85014B